jgi:hydroxymethylglutaryl-CoA lyase
MQAVSDTVNIVEVGPGNGLKSEPNTLAINDKITLIEKLLDAGLDLIEVGNFTSPEKIPQPADTDNLFTKLSKKRAFAYSATVTNEQDMQRALLADVKTISVFSAASDTFTQKHIGCSIDESLEQLKLVFEAARENDIDVRGYLSCVFGCPYEGQVKMADTIRVAEKLFNAGCYEISLIDTVGVGTPDQAQTLILHAGGVVPIDKIAVQFHDTRGQALANILASLEMGISTIDASIAGLGGQSDPENASGNIATEDVVYMLHGLGIESGVDLEKIIDVGRWVSEKLKRENKSRVGLVGVPDWILDR